jgi:ubiquinone/menaquinone biosynthesis C-methylase UbiE
MAEKLSKRLAEVVAALPLKPGMRVLEIGCGPGAAARAVAEIVSPKGFVLAIDRSDKAIAQAVEGSQDLIESGALGFLEMHVERLDIGKRKPFDLAFAIRVGVLDGRHNEMRDWSLMKIGKALKPGGKLYIDGGDPLQELPLPRLGE